MFYRYLGLMHIAWVNDLCCKHVAVCYRHPIIRKLSTLRTDNSVLAKLLAEQLFDNAMVSAGLLDDARSMVNRLNSLLEKVLDKH